MTKYLISTLTAAAAMAVPAFADATLIGSWDFSNSTGATNVTSITSDVAYGDEQYLTISTGGSNGSTIVAQSGSTDGYLDITPGSGDNAETVIDVSGASLTTTEGVSIVMTISNWSSNSGGSILASFATQSNSDAAAIGLSGNNNSSKTGWFAAAGTSSGTVDITTVTTISVDFSSPLTVTLTLVGDTLSIYRDDTLVAQATIHADTYDSISGQITEIGIGSWVDSTNSDFSDFRLVSLEIYKGDLYAAPEPSMFGLFFGLGAIGLVATRRRKRA